MLLTSENAQLLANKLLTSYPDQLSNWDVRQTAALTLQLVSIFTGKDDDQLRGILDPELGIPGTLKRLSAYGVNQWIAKATPAPPAYQPLPAPEPKDIISDEEKDRVFAMLQKVKMELSVTTDEMKRCIDKDGKRMEKRPWYRPDIPKAQMDAMRLKALENLEAQRLTEEGDNEVPNV